MSSSLYLWDHTEAWTITRPTPGGPIAHMVMRDDSVPFESFLALVAVATVEGSGTSATATAGCQTLGEPLGSLEDAIAACDEDYAKRCRPAPGLRLVEQEQD